MCVFAIAACGSDRQSVQPGAASSEGSTVPATLHLGRIDPESRDLPVDITTGGCEQHDVNLSVHETDDTIEVVGTTTLVRGGSIIVNDRSDLPTQGLSPCPAIGFAQSRVLRLEQKVGARRIVLNGIVAREAPN